MTNARIDREIDQFQWLLDNFVDNTAGVQHAVAVSSDGLMLGASQAMGREFIEQVAAITAGLASLTAGAADIFEWRGVERTIVEMADGFMFVTAISQGSSLAVLADKNCDMATVAYEMALLVKRIGHALTPELAVELKNALTV